MESEPGASWPAGAARRGWRPQLRADARGACGRVGRLRSRHTFIERERSFLHLGADQHRHAFGDLSKGLLGLPQQALVAAQGECLEVGANHLPFIWALGQRVLGEHAVLVADEEAVLGLANPNFASRVFGRGRIPAASVADKAVASDTSTLQDQGAVGRQVLNGAEALFGQSVDWSLAGGAMDAYVAGLIQPAPAQAKQVVGGAVVADSRPEVLAHIADAVLGLALGLRTLGATEPRSKAVVLGEVDKAGMEDWVATVVVTQPDRLDAVVENLLWHTAEIVEGLLVTS